MKLLKQFHWFELTLIALVMGVHIFVAFSAPHNFPSRWFTRDDAYYYFKVAENISEGHGSTFDGINLTNGYHPLWMIICIPVFSLARFDLILPLRVLLIIMAALSTATSILLFRLLKNQFGEQSAILAASFWAFNLEIHSIVTQQGMETGIVALSMVLFLCIIQRMEKKNHLNNSDLIYLGFAALFVLFSRLDGIYFIMIAGIWVVFRHSPIRYMLLLDLLLTYFIFVIAFIQRASLKVYFLSFDSSAISMATLTFVIQTVVFYLTGLYTRPSNLRPARILIMTLVGVTISAVISTAGMFVLTALSTYDLPRAVPFYYWLAMTLFTLLTRIALYFISPWPVVLSKDSKPYQGFLVGKNHIKVSLEPLSKWLHDGFIYFGIVALGLGSYMVVNLSIFGTFVPVSGQIKRWWGSMPNNVYGGGSKSVLDIFGIDPNFSQSWGLLTNPIFSWAQKLSGLGWTSDGWYWLLLGLTILALLVISFSNFKINLRRIFMVGLIPLFTSAVIHSFFYSAVAYSGKQEWYWVIQMLALVVLGAIGLAGFIDLLPDKIYYRRVVNSVVGIISIYLAFVFAQELISRMPYLDMLAGQPYMDTLPILEGHTEPGALIGMTGGGNTGYFINNRTIVNMDGLINSFDYFQALKANQGGKFLGRIGLGYIFANRYIITNSMPYRNQFLPEELIEVKDAPVYGQKELMKFVPIK